MPLYENVEYLIRANLQQLTDGAKVNVIPIGRLTDVQHEAINALRESAGLPGLMDPEILLLGRHMHKSRIFQDGYTIDDVILQIRTSLAETSIVRMSPKMTIVQSATRRADGYGSIVRDEAVLELTVRKPKAELFSVIPKGDIPPSKR